MDLVVASIRITRIKETQLGADPQSEPGPDLAARQAAKQIDTAMQGIVNERYQFTRKLLSDHLDQLHKLASLLLEHESVDAEQIQLELGLTSEQLHLPTGQPAAAFSTSRKPGV